ncbi:BaiN/RdsA family NAD(P)/FAD-dependent oxidoreductase [Salinithrix halophila]|uniref:NAD(P)/FAD-dependent oxidoreductase n=1 Tax=Salinithrix halophila TaxID=1485204 RepID=A0ABV8JEP2_9BACL
MTHDCIVVGGGPAGLMAAAAAAERGARVLLLDKGNKLGRKLAISGGGRCNVTNNKEPADIIRNIPGNGRFLYSPFATFDNRDIIRFFESLGVALKEEDDGRMFPVANRAQAVVNALLDRIRSLQVDIRVHTPVESLLFEDDRVVGVRLSSGEKIHAGTVVIAVGGKSVPQTGSTGDGYPWAEAAGHTITDLFPTEVPLTSDESFIRDKELQGLSLQGVTLTVINPKGKKVISHTGDMIFTHFGLSGPIALRCSQFVVKILSAFPTDHVRIELDWFPQRTIDSLNSELETEWLARRKKSAKTILRNLLPERAVPLLLREAALSEDVTLDNRPKGNWQELLRLLKAFPIRITGTLSIEKAFVTGGGVHLKEIVPKTMESKKKQGLYFAGEVLDIHGYTGGYNITAAFSTGYTAGVHAAEKSLTPGFQR